MKLSIAKRPLRVNKHVDTGCCMVLNSADIGNEVVEEDQLLARAKQIVKGGALKKLRKLLDQLIIVIPRNGLPPLHRVPNPWNTDTQMSGQFCEGRERGEALTWDISGHLIIHLI